MTPTVLTAQTPVSLIILAAGQGRRMASDLPKVLVPICGRPMLFQILENVSRVSDQIRIALVVGHKKEAVMEAIAHSPYQNLPITFIEQSEQLGTGHAVKCVMEHDWGAKAVRLKETVAVFPGDLPLVSEELIREMVEPLKRGVALRLLSAEVADPTGYGRVVRKSNRGAVLRIVEEKDANSREKAIKEVGLSIYSFQAAFLKKGCTDLKNKNAAKEYYLTDLIAMAAVLKRPIDTLKWTRVEEVRGVNNPYELALASQTLNEAIIRQYAMNGVRFADIRRVLIEPTVAIEPDVEIGPNVVLKGATVIERGTKIGAGVVLQDVIVRNGAEIKTGTVGELSIIGAGATVGPYAHLRPKSDVGSKAKIGNFVELKNTTIGEKTSVAHLSYLGDATVGKNVNIGCGFVTCNFDGRTVNGSRKHRTTILDDAFIGSDCQVIAPVTIGRGAYVASGSTVTESVPDEALAIARSRQTTKPGYAKKILGEK